MTDGTNYSSDPIHKNPIRDLMMSLFEYLNYLMSSLNEDDIKDLRSVMANNEYSNIVSLTREIDRLIGYDIRKIEEIKKKLSVNIKNVIEDHRNNKNLHKKDKIGVLNKLNNDVLTVGNKANSICLNSFPDGDEKDLSQDVYWKISLEKDLIDE